MITSRTTIILAVVGIVSAMVVLFLDWPLDIACYAIGSIFGVFVWLVIGRRFPGFTFGVGAASPAIAYSMIAWIVVAALFVPQFGIVEMPLALFFLGLFFVSVSTTIAGVTGVFARWLCRPPAHSA